MMLRMRIPISFISWLQRSFVLRLIGVRAERRNAFLESRFFNVPASKEPVTWFHASSLGELEMLKPLIEDFHSRGLKVGVTTFSDSGCKGLSELKRISVYADLSPREEEWKRLFDRFQVKKVILAKYDFWPGLLDAAARSQAPVLVVNAQMRSSLRRIIGIFKFLSVKLPRLFLFPNDIVSEGELKANFGSLVSLFRAVDPRWERVQRRLEKKIHSRSFQEWARRISELKAPVGMIGSAWLEDLAVLLPALKKTNDSLVIVPHDLSSRNLERIEALVENMELTQRVLIVNEMGILVELYQYADWVFVGGGFGKGIHSLLEPAVYGVPVACGPHRYYDFPETKELTRFGILTRCESTSDVERWLQEKSKVELNDDWVAEKRKAYRVLLDECIRIQ